MKSLPVIFSKISCTFCGLLIYCGPIDKMILYGPLKYLELILVTFV